MRPVILLLYWRGQCTSLMVFIFIYYTILYIRHANAIGFYNVTGHIQAVKKKRVVNLMDLEQVLLHCNALEWKNRTSTI